MQSIPFNDDWTIVNETPGRRSGPLRVTIPHDAMINEPRDPECLNGHNTGYFPGGIYRYSKTFTTPPEWEGGLVILDFEGVYQRSHVYLDGVEVGGRPNGYAQFRVPLPNLSPGETHTIEVVADNSQEPNSRWYTGSGIYRPVHLLVGPRTHIEPTWPRVTTRVTGSRAEVTVKTMLVNEGDSAVNVALSSIVTRSDGSTVDGEDVLLTVDANGNAIAEQTVLLADAELWSPESPALHTVRVTARTADTSDEATTRFGVRSLDVSPSSGLQINGIATKLRGACIHHDNGVIGSATYADAERRRVRILKESGFNAIRSAHNPASRALLDACDELGMLVMDEFSDVWTRPKTNWDYSLDFSTWWQRDLEAMVENDFNHPSVIMYSIGNEIGETAVPSGLEWNRKLADAIRQLDPTRPVTNCINGLLNLAASADEEKVQRKAAAARASGAASANRAVILLMNMAMGTMSRLMTWILPKPIIDKKTRDAYAELEVAGYNHTGTRMVSDGTLHPNRVMVCSEETPKPFLGTWKSISSVPYAIGNFVWTGWDYLGEGALAAARYNDRPRMFVPFPALTAGEPVIDITGHRQTQSYAFEIGWGIRRDPFIACRPLSHAHDKLVQSNWRNTDSLRSWSWEGMDGTTALVEVYGVGAAIRLYLNGVVVGTEPLTEDHAATFSLPWTPGELEAVLLSDDGTEIGRDVLRSAGPGLGLNANSDTETLGADGQSLAFVDVTLESDDGTVLPNVDRPVTVRVSGSGVLLGFGSGNPVTTDNYWSGTHTTYYGRALAVIRATTSPGPVVIEVTAEGCEPVSVELTAV